MHAATKINHLKCHISLQQIWRKLLVAVLLMVGSVVIYAEVPNYQTPHTEFNSTETDSNLDDQLYVHTSSLSISCKEERCHITGKSSVPFKSDSHIATQVSYTPWLRPSIYLFLGLLKPF